MRDHDLGNPESMLTGESARPKLPWRQPVGNWMVSFVNSHTNATKIGWNLWETHLRFAPGLTPGWIVIKSRNNENKPTLKGSGARFSTSSIIAHHVGCQLFYAALFLREERRPWHHPRPIFVQIKVRVDAICSNKGRS